MGDIGILVFVDPVASDKACGYSLYVGRPWESAIDRTHGSRATASTRLNMLTIGSIVGRPNSSHLIIRHGLIQEYKEKVPLEAITSRTFSLKLRFSGFELLYKVLQTLSATGHQTLFPNYILFS